MYNRAYKVKDGIVYDSKTADLVHYKDSIIGTRDILAVTPKGNYFVTSFGGFLTGWQVFPYGRLSAIDWAIRKKAPAKAFERLGVTIMPEPDVPADKPYEPFHACEVLCAKNKTFDNSLIATAKFLFRNPDGRFFLYDGMILLGRYVFEENRPMSQLQALRWAMLNSDTWYPLEELGCIRDYKYKGEGKGL